MDKIKASQFADLAYYSRFVPPSRTVTFAAPASTLTDFPALVKCNSTFNIGTQTGYDVHFQDLSGNELPYDLDYYDSVTGNGAWWVKIPSLPSSGATSIKMLYGDSSASTNSSTPLTVWADYAAVYHFNEIDYSYQTNRATGTQSASGIATSGSMSFLSSSAGTGRVLRFTWSGSADDRTKALVTTNVTMPSKSYSACALVNGLASGQPQYWVTVVAPNITGTELQYCNIFRVVVQSSKVEVNFGKYPNNAGASLSTSGNSLHLIGGSFSNTVYRYAQVDSTISSGNNGENSSQPVTNYSEFVSFVSAWAGTYTLEFDELRLCKSAHTQDWMSYEYSNYIDHSNTVTYGPEV